MKKILASIYLLNDEETLGNFLISRKYDNKGSPRKKEMFSNHLVGTLKDQYKDSPSKKRIMVYVEKSK